MKVGSIQLKIIMPLLVGMVLVTALVYGYQRRVNERNIMATGEMAARAVEQQIRTLRAFYTTQVAARARAFGMRVDHDFADRADTLPLPATLVHRLGEALAAEQQGAAVRLFSSYPFPQRKDRVLDAFEREALVHLQQNPKEPLVRLDELEGRRVLRYTAADFMSAQGCVDCHNSHAESPKRDWKVGDVRGAVEVIIPVDNVAGLFTANTRQVVLLLLALLGAMTVAVAALVKVSHRPIDELSQIFASIGEGNLDVHANEKTRDEFAKLAQTANAMLDRLREIVLRLRVASLQLSDSAEEILASSKRHEEGALQQANGFEEISRTAAGNTHAARTIASNAEELRESSEEMQRSAASGRGAVERAQASITEIVSHNKIISERISNLYEKTQAIINVVDIIDNISDRLDLLALNAGLEGSRAGEVGKGFSLVAQEMRRLAENVSGSTTEIKNTVQDIHRLTQAALESASEGTDTSKAGALEMENMSSALGEIFTLIEQTTESSRKITSITQQQLSSTEQMVDSLSEMSSISSQGLTASRDVTRAARELTNLAAGLREVVSSFQLAGSGRGGAAGGSGRGEGSGGANA